MKRILAICMMLVMVLSMSVTVFAETGGFVSSPSANPAPRLVTFTPRDKDCTATVIIVPYAERSELPDDLRELLEKAYDEIVASDDLTKLNADLAKLAADKKVNGTDLAVSDLFDIRITGCEVHDKHSGFDVTLKADTLKNFVALLHMNKDGQWEWVEDVQVENNGENLKFSIDSFSPFAIVVKTEAAAGQPDTGDAFAWIYVVLGLVSAAALITVGVCLKKKSA